jgi:L-aspartate oxidase
MEMMQFHPTCLYNLDVKNFLITEAVRGEGGRLINIRSDRASGIMPDYDARADGAGAARRGRARERRPRSSATGLDYVHLDISHLPSPSSSKGHFPNIYEKLLIGLGIDMTTGPIPVVPAQHYTCGGMRDRPRRASTDLPGLYAAGECSESGLHGANRLASATRCSNVSCSARRRRSISSAQLGPAAMRRPRSSPWDESRVTDSDEEVVIKQNWTEIRRFMWNYVGIVRTTKRLERAQHRIKMLTDEVGDYYGHFRVTPDLIELRNLLQCGRTDRAVARSTGTESRGLHYTLDYPDMLPESGGYGAGSVIGG